MKIIKESSDHHFLTMLETIRQVPKGWIGLHFAYSHRLSHDRLIQAPAQLRDHLAYLASEADSALQEIQSQCGGCVNSVLYLFSDCDIILLAHPASEAERRAILSLYQTLSKKIGEGLSSYTDMAKGLYNYQKLADQRLLGGRRFAAYHAMGDLNRVQSIPLRRKRRDDALILIVEDDRFTASYAASILSKEYELIHARTGEEAILQYIEHAPDLVFLDIHMPGLDGLDTLRALRSIDPEVYAIMLSVDTARTNVMGATSEGAAGFLKKPFSKERMIHLVRQSPSLKEGKRGLVQSRF